MPMPSSSNKVLSQKLKELSAKYAALRIKHAQTCKELRQYQHHTGTKTGQTGETFIQGIFPRGKPTGTHTKHDLTVGKCLIEIKSSGCLSNGNNSTHRKWVWHKFRGSGGKKKYHLLVLVGKADPEFQDQYKDGKSGYVFFAVRHQGINAFKAAANGGIMSLGTNPNKVQTGALLKRKLWDKYEVSRRGLRRLVREINEELS